MPVITKPTSPKVFGSHDISFKMIIAYEDQSALTRAEELQGELMRRCQSEIEIGGSAWNFALLGNSQLRKRATVEGADADMIVIAAHASSELPVHVSTWLKCLLPTDRQAALVVLLDSKDEMGKESPIAASLRCLAEASGLDFFCNLDDWHATNEFHSRWDHRNENRALSLTVSGE